VNVVDGEAMCGNVRATLKKKRNLERSKSSSLIESPVQSKMGDGSSRLRTAVLADDDDVILFFFFFLFFYFILFIFIVFFFYTCVS
jgi:hypothetical protein